MITEKQILKRAEKYGYSGLFALWPHKRIKECWTNWMKNGDVDGLKLLPSFLMNRMAYDWAKEVLELEKV